MLRIKRKWKINQDFQNDIVNTIYSLYDIIIVNSQDDALSAICSSLLSKQ